MDGFEKGFRDELEKLGEPVHRLYNPEEFKKVRRAKRQQSWYGRYPIVGRRINKKVERLESKGKARWDINAALEADLRKAIAAKDRKKASDLLDFRYALHSSPKGYTSEASREAFARNKTKFLKKHFGE
jgi:hypothetical protein